MDKASALAILSWHYDAPYELYNPDPGNVEEELRAFLDPQNAYYAITDERGDLAAHCCFGPEAQVRGGDYRAPALDVGLGVRPDLTDQGRGLVYVAAVLGFARRTLGPAAFRVTVAQFNERALRVCGNAGFQRVQTFRREEDGRAFVVLFREA